MAFLIHFPSIGLKMIESKKQETDQQQTFLKILLVLCISSGFFLGGLYLFLNITSLVYTAAIATICLLFLGLLSLFNVPAILLLRLTILVGIISFYIQVLFTGGSHSPAIFEFLVSPLLTFFYRPKTDRTLFMIICILCTISFFPLTYLGFTKNFVLPDDRLSHAIACQGYIFFGVFSFSFQIRSTLGSKTKELALSIHQLKVTSQKLVHSEKMATLGLLSAGVAHEINNPLNFIQGGAELLRLEEKPALQAEREKPHFDLINEGIKRISVIVNSLEQFSRDSNNMTELCDVHAILGNVIILLQPKLKHKGTLSTTFENNTATVLGNSGKLHQVFLNILTNAQEAIDEDGHIEIETETNVKEVTIKINDDGEGISKEDLKRVNEPFFTTKETGNGLGLGLTISSDIILEHKGSLSISSTPGTGTEFIITFPTFFK
jgi:signal transduction histidine kinase